MRHHIKRTRNAFKLTYHPSTGWEFFLYSAPFLFILFSAPPRLRVNIDFLKSAYLAKCTMNAKMKFLFIIKLLYSPSLLFLFSAPPRLRVNMLLFRISVIVILRGLHWHADCKIYKLIRWEKKKIPGSNKVLYKISESAIFGLFKKWILRTRLWMTK